VTGALWAAAAGIGFGLFQSVNRRALSGIEDAYVSTFLQLIVAALALVSASVATQDLSQLADATTWAVAIFAAAGVIHFALGWTFLNLSQKRIGAARTAPLLTTAPLFGLGIAAVTLGQLPGAAALVAIVPTFAGAYLLSGGGSEAHGRDAVFGLACALMWAISAVLTVEALEGLDSPLLGVTLGVVAAVPAYAAAMIIRGTPLALGDIARESLVLKVLGGMLVGLATWWRLLAIDQTTVGVALSLNLLSVPVVLFVAPLLMGRHVERVTLRVWVGAGLVLAGTLTLVAVD
jgi:drug/metabolite transporter (DMT)-like permease